jgi:hypothetical protein
VDTRAADTPALLTLHQRTSSEKFEKSPRYGQLPFLAALRDPGRPVIGIVDGVGF